MSRTAASAPSSWRNTVSASCVMICLAARLLGDLQHRGPRRMVSIGRLLRHRMLLRDTWARISSTVPAATTCRVDHRARDRRALGFFEIVVVRTIEQPS
jgi:hypothetical protein